MNTLRWCCPKCRAALQKGPAELICTSCSHAYPLFGAIPDLRVNLPAWIDPEDDRRRAQRLVDLSTSLPTTELVAEVFRARQWPEADVRERTRQTLAGPAKLQRDLREWLAAPTTGTSHFLEVGCGSGTLLAAAAAEGRNGIGVDVSLEWLVVAQRLITERGGVPQLAAAMAEALPLPDASMGGVVSLDVVEHVGDQRQYLREINRVLVPGGTCALLTPNRYSLSAEPHVKVWGVGWLPRKWQGRYVRWRSGKTYEYCRLLSVRELTNMFRTCTDLEPHVLLGEIPSVELASFRPLKALIARVYNRALQFQLARVTFRHVCPFFRILAHKGHR